MTPAVDNKRFTRAICGSRFAKVPDPRVVPTSRYRYSGILNATHLNLLDEGAACRYQSRKAARRPTAMFAEADKTIHEAAKRLRTGIVLYRRLADSVVILHCLIGVFFLLGAFLARHHPWIALIHVPLAVWVSAAYMMGWTCPLTPLENRLREAAGSRGYEGSFVDHYLGRLAGMAPPAAEGSIRPKSGRTNEIILGVFFSIMTVGLHCANLGRYGDAIWPPHTKPSGTGAAS